VPHEVDAVPLSTKLVFLLLGLGLGGAYAIMTLGVVSVYRASGVPNFAQGAIAMISAFTFFRMREHIGSAPPSTSS
jgi:branched-chain amino acid transport system permease protein